MKNMLHQLAVLVLVFSLTSCEEEVSNDYPFVIRVLMEDGDPAQNVLVRVSADVPNAIPNFEGSTDFNGEVKFKYDNKAVLKVQASRGNPIRWIGCGFVRLQEGETVTKTIVIQPYDPNVGGC